MRSWRIAAAMALAAAGTAAAAHVGERQAVQETARRAAAAGVSVAGVRFSWLAPLELDGVALPPRGRTRISADTVRIGWRLGGGADARAHVSRVAVEGLRVQHGDGSLVVKAADFDVVAWERTGALEHVVLRQRDGGGTVDAQWNRRADGREARLSLAAFDLAAAEARWRGQAVLLPGRWSGRVTAVEHGGRMQTSGAVSMAGARVALAALLGPGDVALGVPTDVSLAWSASSSAGGALRVDQVTAHAPGLDLEGRGWLEGAGSGARFAAEMALTAELGGALRTAGLRLPEPVAARDDAPLGTARFSLAVDGPLTERAAWHIAPRLQFEPAAGAARAFQFLKRPFRYVAEPFGTRIEVSAGAPDFLPLAQVPPLFLRMLLLSEDAGFFGHPGVDVAEIPLAWAANAERGRFARGASTITQQLARNLFLSKDKNYARKLEEAALALMLDGALPKGRILEIYLNVIEWGPGVHGLVPAARHYFAKRPSDLTAKEMAFLVCLVPSPLRYHSAHRAGHVGPGMEQLMQNLLARLRSVEALTEDEYERAAAEEVVFAPEPGLAVSRTDG